MGDASKSYCWSLRPGEGLSLFGIARLTVTDVDRGRVRFRLTWPATKSVLKFKRDEHLKETLTT